MRKSISCRLLTGVVTLAVMVAFHARNTSAQFDTVINVPPDSAPESIGSNTQFNLRDNGVLPFGFAVGARDEASVNAELNIIGGETADFLAYHGSTVNISGGTVGEFIKGDGGFYIYDGSTVNISGGSINQTLSAFDGSTVNVSGGAMNGWTLSYGATLNISAGSMFALEAIDASKVTITGGTFERPSFYDESDVTISGGAFGPTRSEARITIRGGDFHFNSVPIAGLDDVGNTVPIDMASLGTDAVLSGTLVDGTPFAFSNDDDNLSSSLITLEAAALPPNGAALVVASSDRLGQGIRRGQTLRVDDGSVVAERFNAGRGSNTNVESGGSIGNGFEAIGAEVNVLGGSIGSGFNAFDGSVVNISAGSVGPSLRVSHGSTANITGGTVGHEVKTQYGSTMNIMGGSVGSVGVGAGSILSIFGGAVNSAGAGDGGVLDISGGSVGSARVGTDGTVSISDGTVHAVQAFYGGTVRISGGSVGNPTLVNNFFTIHQQSTADITGGSVLDRLESWDETTVNISGGSFFNGIGARDQSIVNISGGSIGGSHGIFAWDESTVNISAGEIGDHFQVYGTLNISGGSVGNNLHAHDGSTMNISGGSIGCEFQIDQATLNLLGGELLCGASVNSGGEIHLIGTDFRIAGDPIDRLTVWGDSLARSFAEWQSTYPEFAALTGILLDGNEFNVGTIAAAADVTLRLTLSPPLGCDFDQNATCGLSDLDRLLDALGANDPIFDLNGSQVVDTEDIAVWLVRAGNENIGRPYLSGDANLDGLVNAADLNAVGTNWLSPVATSWSQGDFNGDGQVTVLDLNEVGQNWFQTVAFAAPAAAVPEPSGVTLAVLGCLLVLPRIFPR